MKNLWLSILSIVTMSCHSKPTNVEKFEPNTMNIENGKEIAIFAGGCFWCTEAVFLELNGVESIKPGYTGGRVENPSYDQVSMGGTGHAEGLQIEFDPNVITFEKILEIFWHTHNPTTLNQQGNDIGTQYRSAIFYRNDRIVPRDERRHSLHRL